MWYIIAIIVFIFAAIFIVSYRKVHVLSKEGTQLVAYTKYALRNKLLTEEFSDKERYEHLLHACFFYNRFVTKTEKLSRTYHFSIIENGPTYGTVIDVQLGTLITTVHRSLQKATMKLPENYRCTIIRYLQSPLSEESIQLSNQAEEYLFPKSLDPKFRFMKDLTEKCRKDIIEMDFWYTLLENENS